MDSLRRSRFMSTRKGRGINARTQRAAEKRREKENHRWAQIRNTDRNIEDRKMGLLLIFLSLIFLSAWLVPLRRLFRAWDLGFPALPLSALNLPSRASPCYL